MVLSYVLPYATRLLSALPRIFNVGLRLLTSAMETILEAIGTALQVVVGWIVQMFSSVIPIFYDATTGFTFIGTLFLVAFGIMCVWVVINFIKSLVKRG